MKQNLKIQAERLNSLSGFQRISFILLIIYILIYFSISISAFPAGMSNLDPSRVLDKLKPWDKAVIIEASRYVSTYNLSDDERVIELENGIILRMKAPSNVFNAYGIIPSLAILRDNLPEYSDLSNKVFADKIYDKFYFDTFKPIYLAAIGMRQLEPTYIGNIQRKVLEMSESGKSESEIDLFILNNGFTVEQIANYKEVINIADSKKLLEQEKAGTLDPASNIYLEASKKRTLAGDILKEKVYERVIDSFSKNVSSALREQRISFILKALIFFPILPIGIFILVKSISWVYIGFKRPKRENQ